LFGDILIDLPGIIVESLRFGGERQRRAVGLPPKSLRTGLRFGCRHHGQGNLQSADCDFVRHHDAATSRRNDAASALHDAVATLLLTKASRMLDLSGSAKTHEVDATVARFAITQGCMALEILPKLKATVAPFEDRDDEWACFHRSDTGLHDAVWNTGGLFGMHGLAGEMRADRTT
jgi:hypothetical protein